MQQVKGKNFAAIVCASMIVAILALAGCSGGQSSSSAANSASANAASASSAAASATASDTAASTSAASTTASSTSSSALVLGTKTDSAKSITLHNKLGKAITGISIVPVNSKTAGTNLMTSTDQWPANGDATVYFEEQNASDKYNVQITCGAERYELHNLDAANVSEATLNLEGSIAYVTYVQNGNTISSLQDESALASAAANQADSASASAASQTTTQSTQGNQGTQTAQNNTGYEEDEDIIIVYEDDEDVYYDDEDVYYLEDDSDYGSDVDDYDEVIVYDNGDGDYEDTGDYGDVSQDEDSCVDGGVMLR